MAQSALQFHADPRELLTGLIPAWADPEWEIVVEQVSGNRSRASVEGLRSGRELAVTQVVFNTSKILALSDPSPQFMRANIGAVFLQVGAITNGGLRESLIGFAGGNEAQAVEWRRVLRRVRRDLNRGASIVNAFGQRASVPSHLYSDGALRQARSGVSMLAFAGGGKYELGAV